MEAHTLSVVEIATRLTEGSLSSVELVAQLEKRRQALDPILNSFVAICENAMEAAQEADRLRQAGQLLGPMHGIPVTIKDSVDLRGYDSTMGISQRVHSPVQNDAVLVAALRAQGAIFLGKTNVPQALLAQETENVVFGTTRNPWNTKRTPGGSSGGEAAAIAAGLSPIGIGTDIGGSIRIPAHFCGVVGFKPTLDRWSNRGSNSAVLGQELVRAQIGCLARTVADVQYLCNAINPVSMAKRDPRVPPIAQSDLSGVNLRDLTIGIVESDDFLEPSASILRGVREAKQLLQKAGAKIVSYKPVPTRDVLAIWLSALTSDSGRTMLSVVGNDPVVSQLKPSTVLVKLPSVFRRGIGSVLSTFGEERIGLLFDVIGEKSITDLWKLTHERTQLRMREFDAWNEAGLDALLCPPHVTAAMEHRQSGDYALSLGPMFRWTLLNFPAGIVPISTVRPEETRNYGDGTDRLSRKTAQVLRGSEGLPIGVQVVAKPYREDVMLAVMAAIEAGARESPEFPRTPVM